MCTFQTGPWGRGTILNALNHWIMTLELTIKVPEVVVLLCDLIQDRFWLDLDLGLGTFILTPGRLRHSNSPVCYFHLLAEMSFLWFGMLTIRDASFTHTKVSWRPTVSTLQVVLFPCNFSHAS
jgi:hypothetical protein